MSAIRARPAVRHQDDAFGAAGGLEPAQFQRDRAAVGLSPVDRNLEVGAFHPDLVAGAGLPIERIGGLRGVRARTQQGQGHGD
ncbi:hypothetical protein [Microtetraspora fusca]|uniref:hypothetical protein n=1 Tax=Microtetraspora fusca TaxID=1997 RepID=UPI0012F8F244|nr:hypothetical protein [Microtetraspora fusca]